MTKAEFKTTVTSRILRLDLIINNKATIRDLFKIEIVDHGVNLWVTNTIWHFIPEHTISEFSYDQARQVAYNYFRTLDLFEKATN